LQQSGGYCLACRLSIRVSSTRELTAD